MYFCIQNTKIMENYQTSSLSAINIPDYFSDIEETDDFLDDESTIGEEQYLEPCFFNEAQTVSYEEEYEFFNFSAEEKELENLNQWEYFV